MEQPNAQPPPPPRQHQPQQQGDPLVVHREVIDMFPDLDLTPFVRQFGHLQSQMLAALIIDRMEQIPKKQQPAAAPIDDVFNNTVATEYSMLSTNDNEPPATSEREEGELLLDKMLLEMLRACRTLYRDKLNEADWDEWTNIYNYLINHFTSVRAEFVNKIMAVFNGALVPTAIACFFAENGFGEKLQKVAPTLSQNFFVSATAPLKNRRKPKGTDDLEVARELFAQYIALMDDFQRQYPQLLTAERKLTEHAFQIPWERSAEELAAQRIECAVCFDQFTATRIIYCSAPLAHPHAYNSDSAMHIDGGENDGAQCHAFCRSCVRGHANAATQQAPLAEGGVGLQCMETGCKNAILYSDIRSFLKREVRARLDERIREENINMASLDNLERCRLCNFAMQMEVDKHVNKVFHCLKCDAQFCRLCERRWDGEHFGISCDALDQLKKDKRERNKENELTDAVIRMCPRCKAPIVKSEGCNKMTCRCGMTQCYLCRASPIDYSHFCQHLRDPAVQNGKCTQCAKPCLLFKDANKVDAEVLAEIRKRQADEDQKEAGDKPGTSKQADAQQQAGGEPGTSEEARARVMRMAQQQMEQQRAVAMWQNNWRRVNGRWVAM